MGLIGWSARAGRRVGGQARLLVRDTEALARNVTQFTDPAGFITKLKDLPAIEPVRAVADPEGAPALIVLLPAIGPDKMTGGPNTVLLVACAVAASARARLHFVACDSVPDGGEDWFWRHLRQVTGQDRPDRAMLSRHPAEPVRVGPADTLLASFWTTAHQAQALLPMTGAARFLYLIQDFEPGFYPWSSRYAMALATYAMQYHPIVNQAMLADYLAQACIGRFADPGTRDSCSVFEPALDRAMFRPGAPRRSRPGPRRLLVYARPTNPRNMLGMAIDALNAAIAAGTFAGEWSFQAIGSRGSLPPIRLHGGYVLRDLPWADYASYPVLLQEADILLCPMLSPHTGYPVLEMAACGGTSVTNSFATKTAARLKAISPSILAAEPTVSALAAALAAAAAADGDPVPPDLPGSWGEALAGLHDAIDKARGVAP